MSELQSETDGRADGPIFFAPQAAGTDGSSSVFGTSEKKEKMSKRTSVTIKASIDEAAQTTSLLAPPPSPASDTEWGWREEEGKLEAVNIISEESSHNSHRHHSNRRHACDHDGSGSSCNRTTTASSSSSAEDTEMTAGNCFKRTEEDILRSIVAEALSSSLFSRAAQRREEQQQARQPQRLSRSQHEIAASEESSPASEESSPANVTKDSGSATSQEEDTASSSIPSDERKWRGGDNRRNEHNSSGSTEGANEEESDKRNSGSAGTSSDDGAAYVSFPTSHTKGQVQTSNRKITKTSSMSIESSTLSMNTKKSHPSPITSHSSESIEKQENPQSVSSLMSSLPRPKCTSETIENSGDDSSGESSSAFVEPRHVNGSDGGYAGSASSNEDSGDQSGERSSSTSVSSSECGEEERRKHHHHHHNMAKWKMSRKSSSSSELADFSSGANGSPFSYLDLGSSSPRSSTSSDESEEGGVSSRNVKCLQEITKACKAKSLPILKESEQTQSSPSTNGVDHAKKPNLKKASSTVHHIHKERDVAKRNRTLPKDSASTKSRKSHSSYSSYSSKSTYKAPHDADGATVTSSESRNELTLKQGEGISLANNSMNSGMAILERNFKKHCDRAQHRHRHKSHQHHEHENHHMSSGCKRSYQEIVSSSCSSSAVKRAAVAITEPCHDKKRAAVPSSAETPIYVVGCDIMANILCFMEPPEVHSVLTMPLSKMWRSTFTVPQDLWTVLCLSEPFHAKLDHIGGKNDSSDESTSSFPMCLDTDMHHIFGRYRLLYTSFVQCMQYLNRIKDDAINGRPPSSVDATSPPQRLKFFKSNSSLGAFFAKAKSIVRKNRRHAVARSAETGEDDYENQEEARPKKRRSTKARSGTHINASDDGSSVDRSTEGSKKKKSKESSSRVVFGRSELTDRLLGPPKTAGHPGHVNLPWSCAIYSVVNWMVAFADVLGIQIMCLEVLPYLLEDENQRTTAQRAGLTDIVLTGMVLFPDSVKLHTVAFHALVLLARPLGGREGMLFHSAMVDASGIFNICSSSGKNGIAIMLDSMRRFSSHELLQAMGCWSMVNIALIPSQKTMLVKLGGISVATNAMMMHPYNPEVQFRALFALINLVIPSDTHANATQDANAVREHLGDVNETSEREMLDESVGQIANLVVVAMKNFCSSEAILNRACLVLHNLSLNEGYHRTLLWTPNCYQMLEWAMGNNRHDQVLQQSAGGTLQRLQMTLAHDDDLRMRFAASIRAQQQSSLEQARREALLIQAQQQESQNQQE